MQRRPWRSILYIAAVDIATEAAALMLLGGGGGRNMRRSRDPLRTGVLGGYHNSRYLLLFASIAWLILLGGGGGRNMWRWRRQRDA